MENITKEVLILVAHPKLCESKANKALKEVVEILPQAEVVSLYECPSHPFDTELFREKIALAKGIVFQFPFYWASVPSELKRWIDEVFTGLVRDGKVKGKKFQVITTTASPQAAYRSGGRNGYTMDELLRPLQMMAVHADLVWQTPYVVYGIGTEEGDENLKQALSAYPYLVCSLCM